LVNQISIDPAVKVTEKPGTPVSSDEMARLKQQLNQANEMMEHERSQKIEAIEKLTELHHCVDESDDVIKAITLGKISFFFSLVNKLWSNFLLPPIIFFASVFLLPIQEC
jgi:hypothetical protein